MRAKFRVALQLGRCSELASGLGGGARRGFLISTTGSFTTGSSDPKLMKLASVAIRIKPFKGPLSRFDRKHRSRRVGRVARRKFSVVFLGFPYPYSSGRCPASWLDMRTVGANSPIPRTINIYISLTCISHCVKTCEHHPVGPGPRRRRRQRVPLLHP